MLSFTIQIYSGDRTLAELTIGAGELYRSGGCVMRLPFLRCPSSRRLQGRFLNPRPNVRCRAAWRPRFVRRVQDFRQLRVHANAHALALRVRAATTLFPKKGYASLTAQMTSAAESIAFNIVEGCAANSAPEFARFLDIGVKSATELEYQLALARDYGVLRLPAWRALTAETIDVRKMFRITSEGPSETALSSAATEKRITQQRKTHNGIADYQ
jgi:four helix bundle protein